MRWWRVKLHSEGWRLDVEGRVRAYGFYTTRCVSAVGMDDAAEAARNEARWELEPMNRTEGEEPFMQAQSILEVGECESRMGFVFYPLDEDPAAENEEPVYKVVRTPLRGRMRRLWSRMRGEDR